MAELPSIPEQVFAEFLARLSKNAAVDKPTAARLKTVLQAKGKLKAEDLIAAIVGETEIP